MNPKANPTALRRREKSPENSLALVAPAVVLAFFCLHDWWGPDFFYHLFLGREVWLQKTVQPVDHLAIRQTGYINQYWLFQSIIYWAHQVAGFWGVRVVFVSAWLGVFWNWSQFFKGKVSAGLTGALLLLGVVLLQHRMEYRPEVFSYLFASICIRLLYDWMNEARWDEDWQKKPILLWCLLQWLWSNCHGYFFLGTALAGLATLNQLFERRRRSAVQFAALTLLGALAVLLPPLGWRSWWDFWHLFLFLGDMSSKIEEFLPSYMSIYLRSWSTKLFWVFWILTLTLLPFAKNSSRKYFRLGLASVALYLSAMHYRNIPLLPLFAAPLWAETLHALLPTKQSRRAELAWMLAVALCSSWILYTVVTSKYFWSRYSEARFSAEPSESSYPVAFKKYLERNPFEGLIFNPPSDGGYLEFYFPNLRLYGDSRFVDYEPVMEYFRAGDEPEVFEKLHRREHFDGVLLWILKDQRMVLYLLKHPDWRLVYSDLFRAFFVSLSSEKARALPGWPPDWSALDRWQLGDNKARIKQWLLFFGHLKQREPFFSLLGELEQRRAAVSDFCAIGTRTGEEWGDGELVARSQGLCSR